MKSRTLIGAAMAAMLLAPAAYAASTAPSPTGCTTLETQFDRHIADAEVSDHHNGLMEPVMAARSLRLRGATLCEGGNTASGMKDLRHALNDIGVAPAA